MSSYDLFAMPLAEVLIPWESLLLFSDVAMSSVDSCSSSKYFDATSPSLMSLRSVQAKAQVPPGVDMVDLVLEDERENLEEDMSYGEEDPAMELEIIEKDSSQDTSEESYQEAFLHLTLTDSFIDTTDFGAWVQMIALSFEVFPLYVF